jgi:hypothetical protein
VLILENPALRGQSCITQFGSGPQPQNLFGALVDWVERGIAPDQILASSTTGGVARSRPLCSYPQSAVYNGTGSTDVADNFHCGDNVEQAPIACADALVTYKDEVAGSLDFEASGLDRTACTSVNQ